MACCTCRQLERQVSCTQQLLRCSCLLQLKIQEERMSHAQFLVLFHRRLSFSQVHLALGKGDIAIAWCERVENSYMHFAYLSPKIFSARRAPSSLFADLCVSSSSVTGSRLGSVPTPWHTSLMKSAVMSLISLWRIEGKPPREQLRACSMVNCFVADTPRR